MSEQSVALPHNAESIEDLMEAHRQLLALYSVTPAQEHETYSLAQPSPFRFVPSIASNATSPLMQGE